MRYSSRAFTRPHKAVNLHPEFPNYRDLDCTELSAQRNKMKELLVEVAEGAIEEADRSTYYFQLGMGTNNPTTGKNFIGFQSEGC